MHGGIGSIAGGSAKSLDPPVPPMKSKASDPSDPIKRSRPPSIHGIKPSAMRSSDPGHAIKPSAIPSTRAHGTDQAIRSDQAIPAMQ